MNRERQVFQQMRCVSQPIIGATLASIVTCIVLVAPHDTLIAHGALTASPAGTKVATDRGALINVEHIVAAVEVLNRTAWRGVEAVQPAVVGALEVGVVIPEVARRGLGLAERVVGFVFVVSAFAEAIVG